MGDNRAGRPNNYCIGTGSAWIEIRGLTCENFAEFGILICGGHDIRLLNNTMRRLGNSGIAIYSDLQDRRQAYRMLVSGNVIADTNRRWAQTSGISGWGQGISVFGDNNVIRFNRISQTYGEGIGVAGVGNHVIGNTIGDSCSVGLYLDTASNAIVERNFVIQGVSAASQAFFATCQKTDTSNGLPAFGTGIQIASETSSYTTVTAPRLVGNVVRNNVVINGRVGLQYGNYGFDAGGGDGMRDTIIANNIFVGGRERTILIESGRRSVHAGNVIANNIFYWNGAPGGEPVAIDGAAGLRFSHNLWFGLAAGPAQGPGDVLGDPRFANAAGTRPSAFVPAASSPARGGGDVTYRPETDFYGAVRGAAVDIGAFVIP